MQALDAQVDQLRHQRTHLPELADITALTQSRGELVDQMRDAQIVVDDLTAAQVKADADVESVRTRRTRDRDRMDSGQISNPKDLERMQHELVSLDRRIATLEDEEMEVMEQLEEAQTRLTVLTGQVQEAEARLAELSTARDEKAAAIDAELAEVVAKRAPALEGMPEDLLALYERLRTTKGGVGAAELRQRRCTGCQLTIDNAELAIIRAKPSNEVVRCEECTRILVRTGESGL
ncbi:C4-type zinc ribbon domain-containing protein [Nocardioides sp.]|uniref:zinc ribbon domain-containing protein n=1 Tax=Nocardioides sp. TaxID=35761 RepID=UPI00286C898E|nr:C4-type zinc ribbon domain-containing protein [Nocardioides sp.]